MVLVIGNEEADQLMVLAVLTFDETEHEATELLVAALHLESLLAVVNQP